MSGGRALPPSRSRLVEALCLRLLQEYPGPRRPTANQPRQVSRRRLILAAYDRVRGRLHNSRALLEGTGIQLYPLNESTLGKWTGRVWTSTASRRGAAVRCRWTQPPSSAS
ncbi:uncharacterized protein LOC119109876 [Pollicipes pollicipes]|uniref:uncharacterized protein LOC119109876 n=1 Tax=Pollicipes pollicipes TaxID=41117 RepID=UPI0018853D3C|nr:uncharacterized protein LOC119109876 [Pollicipes pollicipes]